MRMTRRRISGDRQSRFDLEIDLHGYHVDTAISRIEQVIYKRRGQSILIIHGMGTGRLRNAVREFVRCNSFIREFHFGEDMNLPGGAGVVLVYT